MEEIRAGLISLARKLEDMELAKENNDIKGIREAIKHLRKAENSLFEGEKIKEILEKEQATYEEKRIFILDNWSNGWLNPEDAKRLMEYFWNIFGRVNPYFDNPYKKGMEDWFKLLGINFEKKRAKPYCLYRMTDARGEGSTEAEEKPEKLYEYKPYNIVSRVPKSVN